MGEGPKSEDLADIIYERFLGQNKIIYRFPSSFIKYEYFLISNNCHNKCYVLTPDISLPLRDVLLSLIRFSLIGKRLSMSEIELN